MCGTCEPLLGVKCNCKEYNSMSQHSFVQDKYHNSGSTLKYCPVAFQRMVTLHGLIHEKKAEQDRLTKDVTPEVKGLIFT